MKLTLKDLSIDDGTNRFRLTELAVEGDGSLAASIGPLLESFVGRAAAPASIGPPVVTAGVPQLPKAAAPQRRAAAKANGQAGK